MRRNRIVATPLIRTASWGLRPMMRGKTNVAPNIATTCWAPSPIVLPQDSRSFGATTSSGPARLPSPCKVQPKAMTDSSSSSTGSPLTHRWPTPGWGKPSGPRGCRRSAIRDIAVGESLSPTGPPGIRVGGCRACSARESAHLQHLEGDGDGEPQLRVGRERSEHPLQLGDPVAQRVVVEEQDAGGLGDVEVGVDEHLEGAAQ